MNEPTSKAKQQPNVNDTNDNELSSKYLCHYLNSVIFLLVLWERANAGSDGPRVWVYLPVCWCVSATTTAMTTTTMTPRQGNINEFHHSDTGMCLYLLLSFYQFDKLRTNDTFRRSRSTISISNVVDWLTRFQQSLALALPWFGELSCSTCIADAYIAGKSTSHYCIRLSAKRKSKEKKKKPHCHHRSINI